jgi:pimeloyl-ACP methyl ester carboxylesterase
MVAMTEPVIEPVFFGPESQRIFGVFHPAQGGSGRTLTLICPPLFSDYMRTHFALRQLAIKLAALGQDVLRIDYRGTGDSFGDLSDVSASDWVHDISLSLREGLELTGNAAVRVLGVRAGALLAARALANGPKIDRFILWDPIVDGHSHLAELRRIQQTMLGRTIVSEVDRRMARSEFSGYRLSGAMIEQLETMSAAIYNELPRERVFVVETTGARCPDLGAREKHRLDYNCDWMTESEDQLLAKPVLECLSSCLTRP